MIAHRLSTIVLDKGETVERNMMNYQLQGQYAEMVAFVKLIL